MANINTVERIYKTVSQYHKNFALLHCVSSYPTPYEDINLNVINLYIEKFRDIVIGYSGHELGIDVCLAAVSMGAKVCFLISQCAFRYSLKLDYFITFTDYREAYYTK